MVHVKKIGSIVNDFAEKEWEQVAKLALISGYYYEEYTTLGAVG